MSWVAAALWVGRTVAGFRIRAQLPLYVCTLVVLLLLAIAALSFPVLQVRLWDENPPFDWTMVVVFAIGFMWCWWARLHLGNLWSIGVSRKEGHHVVDTGPFSIVRHPIYAGILLEVLAIAAVRARPFAFLMALLITVFFSFKARLEERFLAEEFGGAYEAYRQRVPMLVPYFRPRALR